MISNCTVIKCQRNYNYTDQWESITDTTYMDQVTVLYKDLAETAHKKQTSLRWCNRSVSTSLYITAYHIPYTWMLNNFCFFRMWHSSCTWLALCPIGQTGRLFICRSFNSPFKLGWAQCSVHAPRTAITNMSHVWSNTAHGLKQWITKMPTLALRGCLDE